MTRPTATKTKELAAASAGKGAHPPRTPKQVAIEWVKTIVTVVAIWYVLQAMVVKSFRINSGSMERTLLPGEWLFINRMAYGPRVPLLGLHLPAFRDPRPDDLVVFRSPVPVPFAMRLGIEPNVDVVKRLIGVPGDTLAMRGDSLFRNGGYVMEAYARHTDPTRDLPPSALRDILSWQRPLLGEPDSAYVPHLRDWGPLVLPPDGYFVMGDNRDESVDSRFWGILPAEYLKGPVLLIYFSYDPESWRPLPFLAAIRWGRLLRRPG
jgi:signal peptidase I